MFRQWLKNALIQPKKLPIMKEDKLIDTGLIAICIIFLQSLISVAKPDELQTISLILFSIAIPFLAAHFFISKTMDENELPVPVPAYTSAYLIKLFDAIFYIGVICTGLGIAFALAHSSLVVTDVFMASCAIIITLSYFIQRDYNKAIKTKMENMKMETNNLKMETNNLKLEIEKTELSIRERKLEIEKLELENTNLQLELGKLEVEKRNLELKLASTIKH
jgi:hypothetical protein